MAALIPLGLEPAQSRDAQRVHVAPVAQRQPVLVGQVEQADEGELACETPAAAEPFTALPPCMVAVLRAGPLSMLSRLASPSESPPRAPASLTPSVSGD
ncbi:hypothetical protein TSOC_005289 [Tetrabaena socialis]|uniref:Uncharacterized protein n=1 Tax=Tetrabaena socialis TaxID=47790 RepID=A0A2J8A6P3_9CHLO|nr:hypothetical protein TSOC_005289 [Tetrabaena socialis]|eukprot:PNH08202.1 hypothetical protein TSOC_005289 [Tetrabaena socialis]